MKQKPKSAFIKRLILAAGLVGLAACDAIDNIQWPHIYGPNEVPQSVVEEPRAVTVPPPVAADATFPRLGDVPSNPNNFTLPPAIDKAKQQMEDDRAELAVFQQQAETPSVAPPPVVAPPAQQP